jgi:hypothetical protein
LTVKSQESSLKPQASSGVQLTSELTSDLASDALIKQNTVMFRDLASDPNKTGIVGIEDMTSAFRELFFFALTCRVELK